MPTICGCEYIEHPMYTVIHVNALPDLTTCKDSDETCVQPVHMCSLNHTWYEKLLDQTSHDLLRLSALALHLLLTGKDCDPEGDWRNSVYW